MEFIPRFQPNDSEFEQNLLDAKILFSSIPTHFKTNDDLWNTLEPLYGQFLLYLITHSTTETPDGIRIDFHPAVDLFLFGFQMNIVDQTESLKEIKCPTLFIGGTENQATTEKGLEHLKENLNSLKIQIIEGAGHSPQLTHTDQFIQALNNFF